MLRTKDKPFHENLAILLETTLPRSHTVSNKNDEQADCGICYAQYLPVGKVDCLIEHLLSSLPTYLLIEDSTVLEDDEFGDNSGSAPDYTCENLSCSRAFHTVCLRDWLRSITTTRQYVEKISSPVFFSCSFDSNRLMPY